MIEKQVTEAPLMDAIYRNQRHIYDLTRRYFLLGRSNLISNLNPPDRGTILEFGCGTAFNLIQSATRYPASRCYGFDISSQMLKTARAKVSVTSVAPRIHLNTGDATAFEGLETFGVAKFDRVFTSYTLSMIPDWPRAIEHMIACIAHDGEVHIVDFGDCIGLPSGAKRALYAWLDMFHVTPRLDLKDVLADVAKRHHLQLDNQSLFRGYAQYAVLKRSAARR
jgi:S-adenosylmethionine-diacylgycerolhomoserine-N-methlytransferase